MKKAWTEYGLTSGTVARKTQGETQTGEVWVSPAPESEKEERQREARENKHPDKGRNLKGRSTKQDHKHMGVAGPMGRPHFQGVVLGDRSTERLESLPTVGTAPKTQVANKSKHKT